MNKLKQQVAGWKMPRPARSNLKRFILISVWVSVSFVFAQLLTAAVFYALEALGVEGLLADSPVASISAAVAVYGITLALVILVPRLFGRARVSRQILGLTRLPSWLDIILTPPAAVIYLVVVALLVGLFSWLFPGIDLEQIQEVGFDNLVNRSEYVLAFVTLVVIAPLAEELLFRGYLYGKLRTVSSVLPSVLMTSLLFGAAHMQWNVGLDTFALSLILCSLREITGSIWAGTLLHMLKNGVAFYFIFINPSLLGTIGG